MPEPHDLNPPTAQLPVTEPRGVYRATSHRRTALLAAGGSAVVLLALVAWLFSGDDDPTPQAATVTPPAVSASPAPTVAPEPSETEESRETTAPTTAPTSQRQVTPAELIAALTTVVDTLEDQDQLDDDGADALNRRLEHAADRLSRGDTEGASRKVDEFTKKLDDLRDDDDISTDAFTLLTTGATQLKSLLGE